MRLAEIQTREQVEMAPLDAGAIRQPRRSSWRKNFQGTWTPHEYGQFDLAPSPLASHTSHRRRLGHRPEPDTPKRPWRSVQWAIAFHSHDRICDHKVNRHSGADVENALLDAVPVEDVLGPTVSASGDHPEHVLHAESDAGPVMRLHFRHRNEKISLEHGFRKPEMLHSGVAGAEIHADQLVAVQIYESNPIVSEALRITTLREH
jgi:hypothetical protein